MHHLVVALFQLAVDVDILDVKTCQVLEHLIGWPSLNVFDTLLVLLSWHMFDFNLLLQIVHGICQL